MKSQWTGKMWPLLLVLGFHTLHPQEIPRTLNPLLSWAQKQCSPQLECLPDQYFCKPKDAPRRKMSTFVCLNILTDPSLEEFGELEVEAAWKARP